MILIPLSIEKCIFSCWFGATLFHLTSCAPTKSNLYFDISSATALSEPALYILSTFQVRKSHIHFLSLRSFIQRIHPGPRLFVIFCYKLIFYCEDLLVPHPTPKLEDHLLVAVGNCLFNIFTAPLLHPQPEDAPCHSDMGPT
jgi:hypothetical protein